MRIRKSIYKSIYARIYAIAAAVSLVVMAFVAGILINPMEVKADSYYTDEESGVIYGYNYLNGMLTITGIESDCEGKRLEIISEINGQEVEAINERAFMGKGMKSVVIPDTIKYIGNNAFRSCINLEEVIFKGKDIALASWSFANCTALNTLTLPEGAYLFDYVFAHCTNLSKLNLANDVNIGYRAFYGDSSLTQLVLPQRVKLLETEAFAESGLVKVRFEGVPERMAEGIFKDCKSLKMVKLPDGIEVIPGQMFMNCESLERADFPESVKRIEYDAFKNCSSFQGTVLWDTIEYVSDEVFLGANIEAKFGIFTSIDLFLHIYYRGFDYELLQPGQNNTDLLGPFVMDISIAVKENDGIYMESNNRDGFSARFETSLSAPADVQYRWTAYNKSTQTEVLIQDWKDNDKWINWKPDVFGEYVLTAEARVKENESSTVTAQTEAFEYNPYIKGKCQLPYEMIAPGQPGYLIGVETFENPDQSYQYEMLILDCTLLAEGKNAWVYTTGKFTVTEGAAGWCVWQPQYGYYWTLFRVYDAEGNMIDQACYPFVNAY